MPKRKAEPLDETTLMRPASTPKARIKQIGALAYDLAEQRIRNGTASSQEIVYFLKACDPRSETEEEILELNKDLIKAKTSQIKSAEANEKLYAEAIKSFGIYSGQTHVED